MNPFFHARFLFALCFFFGTIARAQQTTHSIAAACERQLSSIEKNIVDVAEAMPEDRFYFSPESLQIPERRLQGGAHVCRSGEAPCHGQLRHVECLDGRASSFRHHRRRRSSRNQIESGHHEVPQRLLRHGPQGDRNIDCRECDGTTTVSKQQTGPA